MMNSKSMLFEEGDVVTWKSDHYSGKGKVMELGYYLLRVEDKRTPIGNRIIKQNCVIKVHNPKNELILKRLHDYINP